MNFELNFFLNNLLFLLVQTQIKMEKKENQRQLMRID
jgi:hypothetical protein